MKISVFCPTKFHAFHLAEQLQKHDSLEYLYTSFYGNFGKKRVFDVLEALLKLQRSGIEAILFIIGDGPELDKLNNYVSTNNISDVYFHGFVNQSHLPLYYGAGDIFVFPTERETWGAVINEAMLGELPIITTTNAAAATDLVKSNINGFTYNVGDIDQLVSYLKYLIDNPEIRHKMGNASLEIISAWSYETNTVQLLQALDRTTSNL